MNKFLRNVAGVDLYQVALLIHILIFLLINFPYLWAERIWPDEALYAWYAKKIFLDPGFIFSNQLIHPPLFPVFLSIGHIFLPAELASRFVPLVISVIGIYIAYRLGEKLVSKAAGLFCAVFLAYNFCYFMLSAKILIDMPLTVFFMLLVYRLLFTSGEKINRHDIIVTVLAACLVLLKWSGIMCLVLILWNYLYVLNDLKLKDRIKKMALPLTGIGLASLAMIVKNCIHIHRFFPSLTVFKGAYFSEPFWFYLVHWDELILPALLIFLMIGFVGARSFKKENRRFTLIMVWGLAILFIVSLVREKDLRYAAPAVPSFILLAATGMEYALSRIAQNLERKLVFIVLISYSLFLIIINSFEPTYHIFKASHKIYTGYRPAGEWLRQNLEADAIILASSPRPIRYYSGLDFQEEGGAIKRIPTDQSEFLALVEQEQQAIYLQLDRWEISQPQWLFPTIDTNYNFIKSLGFVPVKTINRMTSDGEHEVIWILKRPARP